MLYINAYKLNRKRKEHRSKKIIDFCTGVNAAGGRFNTFPYTHIL